MVVVVSVLGNASSRLLKTAASVWWVHFVGSGCSGGLALVAVCCGVALDVGVGKISCFMQLHQHADLLCPHRRAREQRENNISYACMHAYNQSPIKTVITFSEKYSANTHTHTHTVPSRNSPIPPFHVHLSTFKNEQERNRTVTAYEAIRQNTVGKNTEHIWGKRV